MGQQKMKNNIYFKQRCCVNKYGESSKIENNQIALYVVLTRKCNVNCKFCEYHSGESNIDVEKFEHTLKWLLSFCDITTVHFTGGEPTLELDKLKQICKIIKQQDKSIATSVNTNGTNLKLLDNIEHLDNIALSRHAIDDVENSDIFRSKLVPTAAEINEFNDKHKLHLSCNLIKGHIDNSDKIIQYLEFASQLGINDVGIVSLMNVNEYCNTHFIDICNVKESDRLIKNRYFQNVSETTNKICCKCENYLYRAQNLMMISLYHRYAIRNNEVADYLVYENNILRQGFNGNIIKHCG